MIIDSHIHVQPWNTLKPEVYNVMVKLRKDVDKLERILKSSNELIKYLDSQGVDKAVVINYPSPQVMGFGEDVNEFVLNYTKNNRDRLLPCGGVLFNCPPSDIRGKTLALIRSGMKAFKIQTTHQLCYPNDYISNVTMSEFYKILEDEGIPLIIHTGTSIFPGARNKYGDPMFIDDVAVDFPNLTIVIAHIGRPLWPQSSLFLLRRHRNVYADISSIPPKTLLSYFPRLVNVSDKLLFGSDWPAPGVPDIKNNIDDFMNLNLPSEVKDIILRRNALKVFKWK